tara:strand:+ start:65 stop:1405 length:1341 start_codon:yes stop_codon:yes gene_type:complete
MSKIDKIINKFNKAKNAINSLKGIQSKIQSINYTSAIDALGEQALEADQILKERGERLKEALDPEKQALSFATRLPNQKEDQIIYPVHDPLKNYIVFNIRPRNNKGISKTGKAMRGKNSVGGDNQDHPVFKDRSIALYIPDTLISQANVQYRQEGMKSFTKAITDVFENGMENVGSNANTVLTEMAFKGLQGLTGGLAGLRAGIAINPKNEQILDGIPFRSWDFTFDFYAKSAEEALMIRRIIYAFRSSMLPDTGSLKYNRKFSIKHNKNPGEEDSGLSVVRTTLDGSENLDDADLFITDNQGIQNVFMYPNIFDIQFVGPLTNNIDGFLPAVCTNAQVDYSGGQKFSTHQDGMPTKIQLTLNFLEIQIMTLNNYDYISATSLSGDDLIKTYGVKTPSELEKLNTKSFAGSSSTFSDEDAAASREAGIALGPGVTEGERIREGNDI